MSLYKRGNVYWSYIWIHGVRHAKSLDTTNKREAECREDDFRKELDIRRHKHIDLNPEMPFSQLAASFIGSAAVKQYHIERLKKLLPYFGDLPLNEITRLQADEYRRHRKNADQVTDSTVNRDLEALRRILFFAVDSGLLLTNPLSRVSMVRSRRQRRPVLSLEEEDRVIRAAQPHLKPIIIAALDTGMRRGELLSQLAEDLDLNRLVLSVTKSKTPGGEQREIPLTARMSALLASAPKTGLLFTYKGRPIRKLRRSWDTAIRRAGVRPLLFKHLRHTFNTRLMEAGVIQDVRNTLMGHAQGRPRTTNDIYTHVELPMLREAIRRLEAWLASQTKPDTHTTLEKGEKTYDSGESRSSGTDDSFERAGGDSGSKAQV